MKTREELEHSVSKVMVFGLGLSMLLLVLSMALSFLSKESWVSRLGIDEGKLAIAGVLVLVATPVVRVLLCLHHFTLIRDWKYIVLTAWVLLAMILGVVSGAA